MAFAQNVGINTTTHNPQAALDVESTDKGVLLPRLTTIQRTTLGATLGVTDESLLVFDKDDAQFYFWDGTAWSTLQNDDDSDPMNEIELPTTASPGQVPTWDGSAWVAQDGGSASSNTANTTPIVGSSGVRIVKLMEPSCLGDVMGMAYIGADDNIWTHGYGVEYSFGIPGRNINSLKPVVQVIDPVDGEKIGKWKYVFGTRSMLYGVTDEGEVFRRGRALNGQLGNGSTTENLEFLTKMSFFDNNNLKVKYLYIPGTVFNTTYGSVPLTGNSVFALTEDGDVYCWGRDDYGQLGIGNTTQQLTPVKITGLDFQFIHKMSQSGGRTGVAVAALDTLNSVYVWGYNGFGQLGLGSTTNQSSPALVPGVTATDILLTKYAGGATLIITPTGGVMGTGYNGFGAIGDGTTVNKNVFTPTLTPFTNAKSMYMDVGNYCSAVVTADDSLYVVGQNVHGGLGIGLTPTQTTDFTMPIAPFQGMVDKVAIGAWGSWKTLHVIDTLGRIWACGENRGGQLGTGTTHDIDPNGLFARALDELNGSVKFVDIRNFGHFRHDYYSSVVLTEDGRVMTTGAPQYGKTGQGDDNFFRHYYELVNFN